MEFEELKYENKDDLNEIADPSELEDFQKECIYTPLSLVNPTPYEPSNEDYIMREHDGNADEDWDEKNNLVNDVPIERDSLIGFGIHKRKPKLLICITMYNEPPKQLVESLAGIYRSYYELIDLDPTFLNRVHIVIVSDGYGPLMEKPEHLKCYDKANIHDIKKLSEKNYTTNVFKAGFEDTKTVFNRLLFINSENMISREDKRGQQEEEYKDEEEKLEARRRSSMKGNSGPKKKYRDIRAYGANNIGHCFSRAMHFQDWEQCLPREQRDFLVVDIEGILY